MGDNNKYREQLYPKHEDKDCKDPKNRPWDYKYNEDKFIPAVSDIGQIYYLIKQVINHKLNGIVAAENNNSKLKSIIEENSWSRDYTNFKIADDNMREFLRGIYCEKVNNQKLSEVQLCGSKFTSKDIGVDIIKGSIYKIKKYFLENNNLKDIRGGSIMIDYLNITKVKNIMKGRGFGSENIIYCGGGNIFLVTPKGYGVELCETFEKEFTKISLTVMSAFESISCSLYDLLFNFTDIKSEIETKVTERSKMKIYEIDPDPENNSDVYGCGEISLNLRKIDRNIRKISDEDIKVSFVDDNREAVSGVCELCHTRDAKHIVDIKTKPKRACHSCYRKHKVGEEAKKNIFFEAYEEYVISNPHINEDFSFEIEDKEKLNSIDDIAPEIAVIYGDGNNMGNVVKNITNIFEMMYFSRITDERVKDAVYKSIYEVMKSKAKFEVLGLGGDDIFIIVPAEHAFEISTKIIDKFDESFNKQITMSVGIAIAKSATPVTSLFALAQSKLKSAKKLVKKHNLKEGSIDVIELIGDMHSGSQADKLIIDKDSYEIIEKESLENKRVFPLSNSDLKKCIDKISEINGKVRTQLYKIGYAKENMVKEEFELFYFYQNSKQKKSKNSEDISNVYDFIKALNKSCNYADNKFNKADPYSINWNELILLYERGVESSNGK